MGGSKDLLEPETFINEAFLGDHDLIASDFLIGSYLTCLMLFRGATGVGGMSYLCQDLHEDVKFTPWIPKAFSVHHVPTPVCQGKFADILTSPLKAVCKMSNHSNLMPTVMLPNLKCFEKIIQTKAYVYWYIREGMEASEFIEALETAFNNLNQAKMI